MFAGIGVREPQPNASEAFTTFGEAHREIERHAIKMLKTVKPVSLLTFRLQHKECIGFALIVDLALRCAFDLMGPWESCIKILEKWKTIESTKDI